MNTETTEQLTAEQLETLIADAPATDPCAFVPTDAAGVDWVLDKKALADALLTTGEALDFARLNPAEETFYIK